MEIGEDGNSMQGAFPEKKTLGSTAGKQKMPSTAQIWGRQHSIPVKSP